MGKEQGVVPRWFKVFEVGPDIDWLTPGEWVYVEFGRWTEGFNVKDDRLDPDQKLWKVDPLGCLASAPNKPNNISISSANIEFAQQKTL